ncbi:S-adenosyl-L-methionine-dependent methyltransferase, partial [Fragilariopsis cylindrus CCMP1102]
MDLEDTVQICSSYRPHYHEFSSHFAARFVDDIKRVVFVGGGDSMMLHEVLKYPSLEKVIGLELDQTVVRKSFKYFRTQAHFDDDRVEWWFGDATKSLLLLPEDYWGSFDLVIIDLSETVMAFSVTEKLDVFAALALLLNQDGVMVKNEHYMETMSEAFDYTLQKKEDGNTTQTKSAGLLHILDAEDVAITLDKESIEKIILSAAKEEGFTPISADDDKKYATVQYIADRSDDIKSSLFTVVFKEGYVSVRYWPKSKYCAVDVGVWGSYQKGDELRKRI